MSAWEQIVNTFSNGPQTKRKVGHIPDTHKRCALCQVVKPRTEYYKKPGERSNAVTSKCKRCHIAYNNQKERELRERRAIEREKRNKELAEKAKQWEGGR